MEYCISTKCEKRESCKHFKNAKKLTPEKAFLCHCIEARECSRDNGFLRYLPIKEAKG